MSGETQVSISLLVPEETHVPHAKLCLETHVLSKHLFFLQGSIAYSRAIEKVSLLTPEEGKSIREGLGRVLQEWKEGKFLEVDGDEDIHTANERRLKVSRVE